MLILYITGFILIVISVIIGMYVFIRLIINYRRLKKKSSFYLALFMLSFILCVIFIGISFSLSQIRFLLGIFTSLGLISLVWSVFFMWMFTNIFFKLNVKKSALVIAVITILISIFLAQPSNNWDTLSIYEVCEKCICIQCISHMLLIIYSSVLITYSILQSKEIIKNVQHEVLREIYVWVRRGFKFFIFMPIIVTINMFIYMLPLEYITLVKVIYELSITLGLVISAIAMLNFYIGIFLPKQFVGHLYKKFTPMYQKTKEFSIERDKEKFERELRKLANLFFE